MPKKTTPAPTNEAPATKTEEVVKEAEVKEEKVEKWDPQTVTTTLSNGTTIKCVDVFRDALLYTKREGIKDLLQYIQEIGFLEAPCSGGNHLCKKGGLLEHSVNVFLNAERIGLSLLGEKAYEEVRDSIAIAALLHDLGKVGDYGKQMYVDNVLKSGKVSEAKPYKRNPDLLGVPHAIRSVKLATLFVDLTEDEEWAILCHDGLYDYMKYDLKGKETPLQMIIHWADMWASHVQEGGSDDGKAGEE